MKRALAICVMFAVVVLSANMVFAVPAIKSENIAVADGITGQDVNAGTGIKTGHIQDGAITDAKIGGALSVDKLSTYEGIKIVHKGKADKASTFNTITDALNAITDNSETKRYAILVMPGIYIENVDGKSYVDIIGQSRTGSIVRNYNENYTITAPNMVIKNLTIESSGFGGVWMYENSSVYDCTIKLQFGGKWWAYGISIRGARTTVENVSIIGGPVTCGIDVFGNMDNSTIVLRDISIQNCAQGMLLQLHNRTVPLKVSMCFLWEKTPLR